MVPTVMVLVVFIAGPITQSVVLTNNNTDTAWFKRLANWADAMCFTTGRISFYKSDMVTYTSPTNGQTFFYKGDNELLPYI